MDVTLRRELLSGGWSADEIARRRRRGELVGIRRGAYVGGDDPRLDRAEAVHRLRVAAAVRQLGPGAVVSHVSAAVVLGLPTWGLPLDRVHVSRDRSSGARRTRDLQVHAAALDAGEIIAVGGVVLTDPARTVVDIARGVASTAGGFEAAVAVADAALARPSRDLPPLTTPHGLAAALDRAAHRPGVGAARRVVAFADGRSGSVGESRSRVAIARAGLPAPVLQWEVATSHGRCFVDFAWPGHGVVGEFDGRVKYGRLGRSGEDVLWEEKQREDALRATGLWVARWIWADLTDFAPTAARLAAVLSSHR
ncbi:MAG: hypothetical protein NTW05_05060 [Pseudonocardiales bacterium]|jgi:hypothetical protein|nr:hypothetical protein [Pseudonocardiales bacterium]